MTQKKKKHRYTSDLKEKNPQVRQININNHNKNIIPGEQSNSLTILLSLAVIFVAFFIVYPYIFDLKVDLNGDNLNYYYLAKNVSERGNFAMYYDLSQAAHSHFPPGYPWIMALFLKISDSVAFMKALNGAFLLGSCMLIFYMVRNFGVGIAVSLTSVLAILFNANLLRYGTIMMSEVPFIFFSMLCIYFYSKADFSRPFYKNVQFLLGTLAMVYACYIRSQGIAILPGILLFLLLSKKWGYLPAVLGIFFLGMWPWQWRNKMHDVKSDYIDSLLQVNPYRPELGKVDLDQLFERCLANLHRYVDKEIPSAILSNINIDYKYEEGVYSFTWTYYGLGILMLVLAVLGLYSIKKNRELIIGYLLGISGILLLWPSVWFGFRFILPIVPLLIFAIISGIKFILDWVFNYFKFPFSFNALVLVPLFLLGNIKGINNYALFAKGDYDIRFKRYFEVGKWAKENLPEDSYVACRKTELFYHFSGLRPTQFLKSNDQIALLENLKTSGVTHVVLEQLGYSDTQRYLYPVIVGYPQYFNVLFQTEEPKTYLIAFNKTLPLPSVDSESK